MVLLQPNQISTTETFTYDALALANGAVGTPALRFSSATDTGLYLKSGTTFAVSQGGIEIFSTPGNNGIELAIGSFTAPDGSVTTPAYRFTSDPDSGMFLGAVGQLDFSVGGGTALSLSATTVKPLFRMISNANGTAALPTYSFNDDQDLGIYRVAADSLGITAGGSQRLRINPTEGIVTTERISLPDGTQAVPAIKFTSDGDTGFYRSGSGIVSFVRNGVTRRVDLGSTDTVLLSAQKDGFNEDTWLQVSTTGLTPGGSPDTTAAGAGITFASRSISINGGVFMRKNAEGRSGTTSAGNSMSGAFQIGISGDNIRRWLWELGNSTANEGLFIEGNVGAGSETLLKVREQLYIRDGSVGAPSLSFLNDTNSGFYSVAADQIGISVGGSQVGLIDSAGVGKILQVQEFSANSQTSVGTSTTLTNTALSGSFTAKRSDSLILVEVVGFAATSQPGSGGAGVDIDVARDGVSIISRAMVYYLNDEAGSASGATAARSFKTTVPDTSAHTYTVRVAATNHPGFSSSGVVWGGDGTTAVNTRMVITEIANV